MSRTTVASKTQQVDDLWSRLENQPLDSADDVVDTTTIFVGDSGCGKSTLIQSFLKPTATKELKPTFALEYNFARKKAASGQTSSKSVAHIWELGGDIYEPSLLEIPLTVKTIATTTVVICIDLTKPQNILSSLKRWVKVVRELVKKRFAELKGISPSDANALREQTTLQYSDHPKDSSRAKPCEIPLYILINKYDVFKTTSVAERRTIMQVLRFFSHYHGASVITASSSDSSLKENFRNFMNAVCFRGSPRVVCEVAMEKPVHVTAGRDDFESILMAHVGAAGKSEGGGGDTRAKLIYSESDLSNFLTAQGLTRDCWDRFGEHLVSLFGQPDPSPERGPDVGDGETKENENEFPEAEIDDAREQRNAALVRYIQECERKEAMLLKLNAAPSSRPPDDGSPMVGGGGEDADSEPKGAASEAPPREKKSTRRK